LSLKKLQKNESPSHFAVGGSWDWSGIKKLFPDQTSDKIFSAEQVKVIICRSYAKKEAQAIRACRAMKEIPH